MQKGTGHHLGLNLLVLRGHGFNSSAPRHSPRGSPVLPRCPCPYRRFSPHGATRSALRYPLSVPPACCHLPAVLRPLLSACRPLLPPYPYRRPAQGERGCNVPHYGSLKNSIRNLSKTTSGSVAKSRRRTMSWGTLGPLGDRPVAHDRGDPPGSAAPQVALGIYVPIALPFPRARAAVVRKLLLHLRPRLLSCHAHNSSPTPPASLPDNGSSKRKPVSRTSSRESLDHLPIDDTSFSCEDLSHTRRIQPSFEDPDVDFGQIRDRDEFEVRSR